MSGARPSRGLVAVLSMLLLATVGPTSAGRARTTGACAREQLSSHYQAEVDRALRAKEDLWGNSLLSASDGPTYSGARRYLKPLLLARAANGKPLTDSGVYYLAFAQPTGAHSVASVALHVADGSGIISQRADGPKLTIAVGSRGGEGYGACLARLASPSLLDGYLPILQTSYVDAQGVRYRQESFAARVPQTRSLVSFVRVAADARRATADAVRIRFTPSTTGLAAAGNRLVREGKTYLYFSPGGTFDGSSLSYSVSRGGSRTMYVAWLNEPSTSRPLTLDGSVYAAARRLTSSYWRTRLAEGTQILVPERRVLDAERSLLIQNLVLTWRYSIGNSYEDFSFPESVDVAQVMSEFGFPAVARAIIETSFSRRATPYPNWKMGEKLVASALYYRLFRDRSFIDRNSPLLAGYVEALGRQITATRTGILQRERYSSDIPDSVYGLHSQAVAWAGLNAIGRVWQRIGRQSLAATCRRLAAKLEHGLRDAVRRSEQQLSDGSLFLPARLLDAEKPYSTLIESRSGSYWNLVTPFALASGLFGPRSPEARGVLRYMLKHGSRLLGLVRAGAYAIYGQRPAYPISGTDEVYGLNVARFLANEDRPDQLVLSLYGDLAAAMTQGTFVSGEGASLAPLPDEYYRAMYLPPNGASNAAFLEMLRLMLVHETSGPDGEPQGLELAYATPRTWLRPGARILVRRMPTSFGPVSFEIRARRARVDVSLDGPRERPRTLGLRLRVPRGRRIAAVSLNGHPFGRFDAEAETIELPPTIGHVEFIVSFASR